MRAQRVLVKRIDVGRHDQPVALRIADLHPVRRIAQGIDLLAALGGCLARAGRAQGFGPGDQCDLDLARADLVGRFIQQQDRAVAIGAFGLDQFGVGGAQLRRHRAARVSNLGKGDLLDHTDPVSIGQQGHPGIGFCGAQGIGHQRHGITPFQRVGRTVVDLADADDHGQQITVHRSIPCAI